MHSLKLQRLLLVIYDIDSLLQDLDVKSLIIEAYFKGQQVCYSAVSKVATANAVV